MAGKSIAEYSYVSGTAYTHTDGLGSPVAQTNPSGTVIGRTRCEAYGNTAAGTNPTRLGFTGHVNDADTGLVYMQQRYYDPLAGRFQSVDPITTNANTGGAFNLYQYAQSNPYTYIDPDGRDSWCREPTQTVKKEAVTGTHFLQTTTTSTMPGPGGATTQTTSGPRGSGQISYVPAAATGVATGLSTAARVAGVGLTLAITPSELGDGTLYGPGGTYAPKNGMSVYRVWGGQSSQWGQFWTPLDPASYGPSYRDLAGLPNVNDGSNLSKAVIVDATGIIVRPAAPLDGNRGGLPEYQVPNPRSQLQITNTKPVSPPF